MVTERGDLGPTLPPPPPSVLPPPPPPSNGALPRPSGDDRLPDPDAPTVATSPKSRREVAGLARGGGLNLVGALCTQSVLVGLTFVLGRVLGPTGLGRWSQAFAFLSLFGLLSLSGFRNGLTRFVAVHRAEDDPESLWGTVRLGFALSIGTSTIIGLSLFLLAQPLAENVFDDPGLTTPFRWVGAILPLTVFADAALSATQGFKTMKYFAGIGLISEPLLRFALVAGLVLAGFGLHAAMLGLFLSSLLAAIASAFAIRKLMGKRTVTPRYRVKEIFAFSMVSWVATLASTGLVWADTIIIGIYKSSTDVGIYNVATRLALLATVAMAPINASFAPRIAELYQLGDLPSLRRTYAAATSWIIRLSLPPAVVLILFTHEILYAFKPAFVAGAAVTVWLLVGKLVDAATGPCGLMLVMSDRVKLNMFNNIFVLALNIGLNIYLVPRYGIIGASIAWTIALVFVNTMRVWQVWHAMRAFPFAMPTYKGLAAAVVAAGAGLVVRLLMDGFGSVIVGGIVVVAVYVVTLVLLGLPDDDKIVVRMFRRRLQRAH